MGNINSSSRPGLYKFRRQSSSPDVKKRNSSSVISYNQADPPSPPPLYDCHMVDEQLPMDLYRCLTPAEAPPRRQSLLKALPPARTSRLRLGEHLETPQRTTRSPSPIRFVTGAFTIGSLHITNCRPESSCSSVYSTEESSSVSDIIAHYKDFSMTSADKDAIH